MYKTLIVSDEDLVGGITVVTATTCNLLGIFGKFAILFIHYEWFRNFKLFFNFKHLLFPSNLLDIFNIGFLLWWTLKENVYKSPIVSDVELFGRIAIVTSNIYNFPGVFKKFENTLRHYGWFGNFN